MTKYNDVKRFLDDFKVKLKTWGIIYWDDRSKNTQALLDLEFRPVDRTNVIRSLKPEDFSDGPIDDVSYGGSQLWVFGKVIKQKEVYIKITLGNMNNKTICISFHIAEHSMTYPFK